MDPVQVQLTTLAQFMLWANMNLPGELSLRVHERVATVGLDRFGDPGEVVCTDAEGGAALGQQTIPSAARWLLIGEDTDGRKCRPST